MILIELCLSALALALAFFWPGLGSSWFVATEHGFGTLARRRKLSVLLVGVLALAARAAVLPILPIPQPRVDDEFSYLLAADTFAHGRLTNPSPPLAEHFQTLAAIVRPSYQSITPPAQGLVMALGKVLFGKPFWGVWLSMSLMCGAICWALQGWLPPEWALLGGLIAVMRWGVFSYWANSYWGGAVAATGGALIFGALPRIVESPKVRDALFMGLGLAVLANSRPYEGLVFSLPVAVVMLTWLLRKRGAELGHVSRRVVLPLLLLLAATVAAMGYYNWRVTGKPLLMPHQLYNGAYDPVPPFLGMRLGKIPPVTDPAMNYLFYHVELHTYRESQSLVGILTIWMTRAARAWVFFLGPVLSLPLLVLPLVLPAKLSWKSMGWRGRFLLEAGLFSVAGLAIEIYGDPHYEAPMTCMLLAMVLLAMQALRDWNWKGKASGVFLTRAVPVVCLAMLAIRAAAAPLGIQVKPVGFLAWYTADAGPSVRSSIGQQLERLPGRQLVFVHYGSYFGTISGLQEPDEWAFNSANIEGQKVVWANDLGLEKNKPLIDFFKGWRVWMLDLSRWPPKLTPYREEAEAAGKDPG